MIKNPILEPVAGEFNYPTGFLQAFVPKILTISLVIAAIVFVFIIIISGISWMMAGGDKQAIESARSRLTNGLVGFIIVLSVFAIAGFIGIVLGVDILRLDITNLIVK